MPEETTLTPLRPSMIDALTLALVLRPPGPLSSRATRLWDDTLQSAVPPAPGISLVDGTPACLGHSGGDQLGIAFVATLPLCKCLRAQKTWNLILPYSRNRAKHFKDAVPSSTRRSTAFVQPSFCIGYATQKLLIRFCLPGA